MPAQSSRKTSGEADPSRIGKLRAVDLDQHVIHAATGERGHQVLDRTDLRFGMLWVGQRRAKLGACDPIEPGRQVDPEIGAAKDDAVTGSARD